MSTSWTKPARRVVALRSSPGSTPGAAHRRHRQGRGAALVRRPDDEDGIATEVDLLEQPAEELVGPAQCVRAQRVTLVGRREGAVRVGAHEVGRLDQHDRLWLPQVGERRLDLGVVELLPERRPFVGFEEVGAHPAALHDTGAVHERAHGGTPVDGRVALGLDPVTVGDDSPRRAGVAQRVAERAGLGVEREVGVGVLDVGDGELDELAPGRGAGPAAEHLAREVGRESLVDAEALAVGAPVADRPGAGTDRHVAVADEAAPALEPDRGGPGRQVGDAGPGEEPVEVGQVGVLHVGPRHHREREDQDPVDLPGGAHGLARIRPARHTDDRRGHRDRDEEGRGQASHGPVLILDAGPWAVADRAVTAAGGDGCSKRDCGPGMARRRCSSGRRRGRFPRLTEPEVARSHHGLRRGHPGERGHHRPRGRGVPGGGSGADRPRPARRRPRLLPRDRVARPPRSSRR